MADLLLFHHAQGLTRGISGLADQIRAAGHTVHVPDLFDGQVFPTLQEGAEYDAEDGFGTVMSAVGPRPPKPPAGLVFAGVPSACCPAQADAGTDPAQR